MIPRIGWKYPIQHRLPYQAACRVFLLPGSGSCLPERFSTHSRLSSGHTSAYTSPLHDCQSRPGATGRRSSSQWHAVHGFNTSSLARPSSFKRKTQLVMQCTRPATFLPADIFYNLFCQFLIYFPMPCSSGISIPVLIHPAYHMFPVIEISGKPGNNDSE